MVDFLVIAAVVFFVVVKLMGPLRKKEDSGPTTKACSECLETIPLDARRCRACAAPQNTAQQLQAV